MIILILYEQNRLYCLVGWHDKGHDVIFFFGKCRTSVHLVQATYLCVCLRVYGLILYM